MKIIVITMVCALKEIVFVIKNTLEKFVKKNDVGEIATIKYFDC